MNIPSKQGGGGGSQFSLQQFDSFNLTSVLTTRHSIYTCKNDIRYKFRRRYQYFASLVGTLIPTKSTI
jgi:hypothetical protein